MSSSQISCVIGSSDPTAKLGLEVWVDDTKLADYEHVDFSELPVSWEINDDQATHELRFVLKNKLTEHTKIDADGNIIKDATISVTKLAFEEIELNQLFYDLATYEHDFNGTQDLASHKFYGNMGCNGTVKLSFATPVYLWLLENF